MIGQTLSHYRIVEKIGAGGMGEVYKAHDERLDRDVAIKVLPSGTLADEQARKRFRKEALALSKLNHPNIATVHDFDTQEGVDFIVMEYVEGASLAEKVKTGPLPEKEISELGAQIADALEEAHERGIVHRDLKPGNIAVTPKGRVKVLDFGLARMLQPVSDEATTAAMTEEHAVAGTLPYMAPEELRGERADHRSDLYSFGVVLYEVATGRRPFEEKLSTALTAAIVQKPPEPPSTHNRKVSPGLESIIIKALDKNPDHRYQSAREMRVDLERLSAPVSVAVTKRKPVRASRWLWAAAGLAVVVVVVLVALNVGGLQDWLTGGPSVPSIDSIAVLPLENLSGDPEQEYFVDGMTDALITDLSKIGALKVISRTSSMSYRDSIKPIPEIAKELNAEGIVEGSVLRVGERVRITAQLIEAATDHHLWAESYERELRDVLSLQRELAQAIAQEIKVTLTPDDQTRLAGTRTVNPEAYEAYLKGRYYWNKRTGEGFEDAIEHFQKAIEVDPSYAPAYAGLADSYSLVGAYGIRPQIEVTPKAKAAALRAIEIDDKLGEAYTSLGRVRLGEYDWTSAEQAFERGIELSPNYATGHHWYGRYLTFMGRFDEAATEMEKARKLDPLSIRINTDVGHVHYCARRYDQAIEQYRKTLELDPNFLPAHGYLGRALLLKGMYTEAIAEYQRTPYQGELGRAYAMAGKEREAQNILTELKGLSKQRYLSPLKLAEVYIGLGEKDQAVDWLEQAYKERSYSLAFLKFSPSMDPLRDNPRFQDLLRRMNFPE